VRCTPTSFLYFWLTSLTLLLWVLALLLWLPRFLTLLLTWFLALLLALAWLTLPWFRLVWIPITFWIITVTVHCFSPFFWLHELFSIFYSESIAASMSFNNCD
jgi:hypothetical protein